MSSQFEVSILNNVVESANTISQYVLNHIDALIDEDIETATKVVTEIMAVLKQLYTLTDSQESQHMSTVEQHIQQLVEISKNRPDKVYNNLTKLAAKEENDKAETFIKADTDAEAQRNNSQTVKRNTKTVKRNTQTHNSDTQTEEPAVGQYRVNLKSAGAAYNLLYTQNTLTKAGFTPDYVTLYVLQNTLPAEWRYCLRMVVRHVNKAHIYASKLLGISSAVSSYKHVADVEAAAALKPTTELNAHFIAASHYIKLIIKGQRNTTKVLSE